MGVKMHLNCRNLNGTVPLQGNHETRNNETRLVDTKREGGGIEAVRFAGSASLFL